MHSGREGDVVDGRFELHERIGSGGFAVVWRATDREREETVAVKCGSDDAHDTEQVRARFHRELHWFRRFAGGPTPGSLVHFVDGAVGDDGAYVATELVDGGSVDGEVSPGLAAVAEIGLPICRALEFFHRNGVLHLDLKPSNVLCRRRGPPALIDLNSAVASDEGTEALFYQDAFKPPELTPTDCRDERTGPWSDVYALGSLLVYLLTGETAAFDDESVDAWHAVDPRSYGVDCTPELAAVLRTATEPRPHDRFADAGDLYAALASHLGVPDRTARLAHGRSGTSVRVHPRATIGRWTADRPIPTVVVRDEERFLSPEHAVVAYDGGWYLRDRSLNGTYVYRAGDDDWKYVLSREGAEERAAAGREPSRSAPPEAIRLADGDLIAPVDPGYGCDLVFRVG